MTKRLRKKIILLSLGTIFGFLVLILGIVNIVTWANIVSSGDQLTSTLLERGGEFNGEDGIFDPTMPPPGSEEGQQPPEFKSGPRFADEDTRYFVVTFNADGSIDKVDTRHIATISEEEAKALASNLKKDGAVGFSGNFRYRYSLDGKAAAFVDMSRMTAPAYTFLWTSLGVMGGGLIVAGITVPFLAKWMLNPLEESLAKQKRFISDASHELKTPLSIISANNEIEELERGESESTLNISRQVVRMSELIRSLNSMVKLDEMSRDVELGSADLTEIANSVAASFQEVFASRGIEFDAKIEEGLLVQGNEEMLKKLLSILLDNAYKYSLTKARLSLHKAEQRIQLVCSNDAELEKEGAMDEVFDRFYRSPNARAGEAEGSGIGLSIAKEIVDLHGGRIHAYSRNGEFIMEVSL